MLAHTFQWPRACRLAAHTLQVISNDNGHYRCLAHIINLATQALISTRSKAKYYNPHSVDEHSPDFDAVDRDELGLVRAISVKVRVDYFS